MFLDIIIIIVDYLILLAPLLIMVAIFTLFERKVIGHIQRRKGPNVLGFFGLFQPFADGIKLFLKESIFTSHSFKYMYISAPIILFVFCILPWLVIPIEGNNALVNMDLSLLFILAISSLNVYGVLFAGWSSNSTYAFLGCLRSAAQMIAYEVSIGIIILSIIVICGSFNLVTIVIYQKDIWFIFPLFPGFLMFFISVLAETNRHPFDLPEAEAELVSGYNTEYSGMFFGLFFVSEYVNIILMSNLSVIFFFGGWSMDCFPFFLVSFFNLFPNYFIYGCKVLIIMFFFIWVRATLPRYRYDQLMSLGWKVILPFSLGWLIFITSIILLLSL